MFLSNTCLLGFLVCRIEEPETLQEKRIFQQMSLYAESYRLQVCIFSLFSIDWAKQTIQGLFFEPQKRTWERRESSFPSVIYDRTFISSVQERDLHRQCISRFQQLGILLAGYGLKDKWSVYTILKRDPLVNKMIPETIPITAKRVLRDFLTKQPHAFLKPRSSSKGRGTIQVVQQANTQYSIKARDGKNSPIELENVNTAALFQLIHKLTEGKRYLLQPDLGLVSAEGNAFDIRVLMQKNAAGSWSLTGMAVRKGKPGSATSNLHGGGEAMKVMPFLVNQYGAKQAGDLYQQILQTAQRVPEMIEYAFGRFYELGIDYGIDRLGEIWLLEVNSKPGRAIFAKLGDHRKRSMSLCKPLMYARYLMNWRPMTGHALQTFRRVT